MLEDDADVATLVSSIIDGLEVAPDVASLDGMDCRDAKLFILDLELPDGHGLDVLRGIRKDPLTAKTPVVVFTNVDAPPDAGMELGANAWVRKPADAAGLEHALRSIASFWIHLNQVVTRP